MYVCVYVCTIIQVHSGTHCLCSIMITAMQCVMSNLSNRKKLDSKQQRFSSNDFNPDKEVKSDIIVHMNQKMFLLSGPPFCNTPLRAPEHCQSFTIHRCHFESSFVISIGLESFASIYRYQVLNNF